MCSKRITKAGKAAHGPGARFALFNRCRPMRLEVDVADLDNKEEQGLRQDVRIAAKNQLLSAKLYNENKPRAKLSVRVSIVGGLTTVDVQYYKTVTDEFGNKGAAVTWTAERTSMHGQNPVRIVKTVVNDFLIEYMDANRPQCDDLGTRRPDGLPVRQ